MSKEALSAHLAGWWPHSRTPGAGPPASHPLGTQGEFLQTTHTMTPSHNRRVRGQGAPHTQHVKNNHPQGTWGVWGTYNSPGLVLLGFLVTGLWLLNLTVAVSLKAVNTSISILHTTKQGHRAVKWPSQDRTKCWSLIVKLREESRSPETWFNRSYCHYCTEVPFPKLAFNINLCLQELYQTLLLFFQCLVYVIKATFSWFFSL